ncbi:MULTISPECIES: Na+/H+ antiporter NhaC family protein [Kordiimonas]|jgi:Na+/H+ antiporter NhaC|uniref:Na+/H+ antiporter NhaC family protein n=1 Tax=Kordiimonas TaxID=288021 RepID=UPI00257F0B5F|nr:Na+/H+ antiporter NhaC family protein [Kordiimonas sp. UBA4487]
METAAELSHQGILTLIPTLVVLVLAVTIRRPIEALIIGAVVGIVMLDGGDFVIVTAETTMRVLSDEDLIWVILVCGAMGSLIGLLIRTGALAAFVQFVTKRVKTRFSALMATWALGISLFVDDYLNSITAGAAMRKITDQYRVSREMLAYVIDSTAAPVSVIIPLSTWGVFFAKLLEENGLAAEGQGLWTYISGIPYMLYPWIAIFIIPLVAAGKFPLLGPMKKAEYRAREYGQSIPPGAEHVQAANETIVEKEGVKRNLWLFVLPLVGLVGFTIYYDMDFLPAVYATLALMTLAIIGLRILDHHDTFNTIIDGFKIMVEALAIIFAAYMLKDVNEQLGLTSYILELTTPFMTATTLPFIVFGVMGLIAFATGSSWGMFVIALPVIADLALSTGASIPLVIGATLSASTFGSHACLYADATVLTAQSCGTTSIQHALTQLPYAVVGALISLIGFAILA